jgi:F0F1-type ATP synthase assembly protein I
MSKRISATEGIWFGLLLLGQVTGVLVVTAIAGVLLDKGFGTSPIFFALGVAVGSIWATVTVLLTVRKELGEDGGKPEEDADRENVKQEKKEKGNG